VSTREKREGGRLSSRKERSWSISTSSKVLLSFDAIKRTRRKKRRRRQSGGEGGGEGERAQRRKRMKEMLFEKSSWLYSEENSTFHTMGLPPPLRFSVQAVLPRPRISFSGLNIMKIRLRPRMVPYI